MVGGKLHAVRAEPILEMLPALGVFVDIELRRSLFPGLKKVAENVQAFGQRQFGCHRGKLRKVCHQIRADAGEIAASLVRVALYHADGQVALPHNAVAGAGNLRGQHFIKFVAVFVKTVCFVREKYRLFKFCLVDTAVVNCNFG